jgi:hypothetical protein
MEYLRNVVINHREELIWYASSSFRQVTNTKSSISATLSSTLPHKSPLERISL